MARAARADEDVICGESEALEAQERGFPRLVVTTEEVLPLVRRAGALGAQRAPVLILAPATRARHVAYGPDAGIGVAILGVDDRPARLAALMGATASPSFADEILRGLGHASGRPLPAAFCGFARRVLEYPARYADLNRLTRVTGVSQGALKARFRRRGLPSPFLYLRWFRILAAGHLLSTRPQLSIGRAALLLGFSSGGNFCRAVAGMTGLSPSRLRERPALYRLIARFAGDVLPHQRLAVWEDLYPLFLRTAA